MLLDHAILLNSGCQLSISYLIFIKYCARATDSLFPVILIVRSRFAGASLSSQLEFRIIAPESCLKVKDNVTNTTNTSPHISR